MSQRGWTQLVHDPAARHLVAARIAPKAADEPAALLVSLIEQLCPNGDYALLTRCEEDCAVTLCAFALPGDAEQLASAVGAYETDEFAGWASQHCFTLDPATAQAIGDAIEASGIGRLQRSPAAPVLSLHH